MAAPYSTFKPEYCAIAIKVLSAGESIVAVAAELGVCRDTVYDWKEAHPEFAKALKVGLASSQRVWEQMGVDGITGKFERFAGAPWMFTMKNRFRDDYLADEKKDDKTDEKSVLEKIISGEIVINKPAST